MRRMVLPFLLFATATALAVAPLAEAGTAADMTSGAANRPPDVAVSGSVLDAAGTAAVTDATVTAWWVPSVGVESGRAYPMVTLGSASTTSSGSYSISAKPTPAMEQEAAANGGWVNFYVSASSPSLDKATTMMVGRQIANGSFVTPAPLARTATSHTPMLRQTKSRARRRASDSDENPSVSASLAPSATLLLTQDTTAAFTSGTGAAVVARAAATTVYQCKFTYYNPLQATVSVVEFHNATNADGNWHYGYAADSDIEGGIQYVGQGWGVNGTAHISNSRSLRVGMNYNGGTKVNNYGRSDFLFRIATITTLSGSTTPAGGKCSGYPADLTIGTHIKTPYQWVGGVADNSSLPGAEFIGCDQTPQSLHKTAYPPGADYDRNTKSAAKIGAAGNLGPLWVGATSGFSTDMTLHYDSVRGNGMWLCGTNYWPDTAGVVHAQNK